MDPNAPIFEGCSNYTRSEILSKLALAIIEERFSNYFHTDNYDRTIISLSLSFYFGGAPCKRYALVFSVTPFKVDKIKIKIIRQVKSRIWEMKGGK